MGLLEPHLRRQEMARRLRERATPTPELVTAVDYARRVLHISDSDLVSDDVAAEIAGSVTAMMALSVPPYDSDMFVTNTAHLLEGVSVVNLAKIYSPSSDLLFGVTLNPGSVNKWKNQLDDEGAVDIGYSLFGIKPHERPARGYVNEHNIVDVIPTTQVDLGRFTIRSGPKISVFTPSERFEPQARKMIMAHHAVLRDTVGTTHR